MKPPVAEPIPPAGFLQPDSQGFLIRSLTRRRTSSPVLTKAAWIISAMYRPSTRGIISICDSHSRVQGQIFLQDALNAQP